MTQTNVERAQGAFLARIAYFLGITLFIVPLADIAIGLLPTQFGNVRWRVGATGLFTGALLLPIIGIFLALVAAHTQHHRRTQIFLTIITGIGALILFLLLGMFVLDTLQLRNEVAQDRRTLYDRVSMKGVLVQLMLVIALAMMSIGGWRASRAVARAARSKEGRGEATPIVVGQPTPTAG
jgi:hypothetical protein